MSFQAKILQPLELPSWPKGMAFLWLPSSWTLWAQLKGSKVAAILFFLKSSLGSWAGAAVSLMFRPLSSPSPHPYLLGLQSLTLDTALEICALTTRFIWRHSLLPFCLVSTQDWTLSSGLGSLCLSHGGCCWARSSVQEERPWIEGHGAFPPDSSIFPAFRSNYKQIGPWAQAREQFGLLSSLTDSF